MSTFGKFARQVDKMCRKFGTAGLFCRFSPVVYYTGDVVRGDPVQAFTANLVVLPVTNGHVGGFDDRLVAETLAHKTGRFFQVAALDATFEPRALDRVTVDGVVYSVVGCTPINPAGTPVTYGVGVYAV